MCCARVCGCSCVPVCVYVCVSTFDVRLNSLDFFAFSTQFSQVLLSTQTTNAKAHKNKLTMK